MSATFEVGTVVVGENPQRAGCSTNLTFGVVTKITATGKYRVHALPKEYYDHDRNRFDQNGSSRAVRPRSIEPEAGAKSWLVQLDGDDPWICLTNNKSGRGSGNSMTFRAYDATLVYVDEHDNGD
jgi:hypothetical protein